MSSKPFSLRGETTTDRLVKVFSSKSTTSGRVPPLRVLPALLLRLFAAVFLCSLFPVLPLPPPLLALFLLGGFAPAGDDAVQHPLVSVRAARVRLHQRLQLVPHDAVLFIPDNATGSYGVMTSPFSCLFSRDGDKKPLWAFASGPHGGDRERVVLPLHVYKIVNGLLAGQNVFF